MSIHKSYGWVPDRPDQRDHPLRGAADGVEGDSAEDRPDTALSAGL